MDGMGITSVVEISLVQRGIRRFDLRTPTTFPSLALRLRRLSGGGGPGSPGGASERAEKPRKGFSMAIFFPETDTNEERNKKEPQETAQKKS